VKASEKQRVVRHLGFATTEKKVPEMQKRLAREKKGGLGATPREGLASAGNLKKHRLNTWREGRKKPDLRGVALHVEDQAIHMKKNAGTL